MKFYISKNNLLQIFFLLAIATQSIYIGFSGSLQIHHFFVIFAFFFCIYFESIFQSPIFLITFISLIIASSSEVVNPIIYNSDFSVSAAITAFYISFIILIITYNLNPMFFENAKYAILISLIITLSGIIFKGFSFVKTDEGVRRAVGFFNNPNQLASYTVGLYCFTHFLLSNKNITFFKASIFKVILIFLTILSLSKASIVSLFFVFLIEILLIKKARNYFLSLLILLLPILIYYISSIEISEFVFLDRLLTIGQSNDDNLSSRGYLAIYHFDIFNLFFGLSDNIARMFNGREVHSTLGGFLINYGLIIFIFHTLTLLYSFFCYNKIFGFYNSIIILLPLLLYGITHNGSRNILYWLLIFLPLTRYLFLKNEKKNFLLHRS